MNFKIHNLLTLRIYDPETCSLTSIFQWNIAKPQAKII